MVRKTLHSFFDDDLHSTVWICDAQVRPPIIPSSPLVPNPPPRWWVGEGTGVDQVPPSATFFLVGDTRPACPCFSLIFNPNQTQIAQEILNESTKTLQLSQITLPESYALHWTSQASSCSFLAFFHVFSKSEKIPRRKFLAWDLSVLRGFANWPTQTRSRFSQTN